MTRPALRDMPRSRHPFRYEQYSKMYDALDAASRRFIDLGYPDLAAEMSAVRARLSQAWDAIFLAEREGR